MRLARALLLPLLILLGPSAAHAQYVFLDVNGDGVNDGADQLNPSGPTDVDVWFVTDHNRDGSAVVCSTESDFGMTINSYEIVLRATNGSVQFGPMRNRMPYSSTPVCFATYEDTTNATIYHNGWGYRDIFPPGRYRVATLTVRVLSGNPTISFLGYSPIQPTDLTSFGTKCSGINWDNTAVLGEEFSDAGGLGPPTADAGGPYSGMVGRAISFDGSRSIDPDGGTIGYHWAFDDGGSADGVKVTHAFDTSGAHSATLTVSSSSGQDEDTAEFQVAAPYIPVAIAGGPYHGIPGYPVGFDGSASFDPDGDPLSYAWTFGDGGVATGARPQHIYAAAGSYAVTLTVTDGQNAGNTSTIAEITAPNNHAPIADTGGPYSGVVGRWISFAAIHSSDPDGDFLSFVWNFGDGSAGVGIVSAHTYNAAGAYPVSVTASDGLASATAATTATIEAGFAAHAFLPGGQTEISLDATDPGVAVRFEPVDGSYSSNEVDIDWVNLDITRTDGGVAEIPASMGVLEADDSNGNGVSEYVAIFPRETFRELSESGAIGSALHLDLTGGLYGGGAYHGPFEAALVTSGGFNLVVTPNPFNPEARVTIHTRAAGMVSIKLYDVRGRFVRTVVDGKQMPAGRHDFTFVARDDAGVALASGVYFMRVTGPEGAATGRVVVAK